MGTYFVKGWWTDENDKGIKEALIGQKVKFHIQMDKSKVPAGSKIDFTLKDWDGIWNEDDSIELYSTTKDPKTNTYPKVNQFTTDANGKASLYINLGEGLVQYALDDGGNEIELYFECSYDKGDKETEKLDLPSEEFNYLIVYEKKVLITVFVELPHTNETGWSAKGLAGHSAMAIGERYFDYGPDYDLNNNGTPGYDSSRNWVKGEIVSVKESDYDVDFNEDGDKNDIVDLDENNLNFKNAPGRPWWGEMVAENLKILVTDVKLKQVNSFIMQHWHYNNVYGKLHKIEFYVKENEANKMTKWWEERYKHLKIYSVYTWTGEQCTTTVKTAIHQAFDPSIFKRNYIPDTTQTPKGLLEDLQAFESTSKQHTGQLAKITILKEEAIDWP